MSHFTKISTKKKSLRGFDVLLRVVVVFLLAYVIYDQMLVREDAAFLWSTFVESLKHSNPIYLIVAFCLMPLNWILESKKWQMLIRSFEKQTLLQAIKTVLGGVVFSLFTPARVGEYGGRVLFVKPENNWRAVAATMVGSLSQLLIVLFFGGFGLILFSQHIDMMAAFPRLSMIFIWLAMVSTGIFFFFNIDILINLVKRINFLTRFKGVVKAVRVVKQYPKKILLNAVGISCLRYMVYSLQYLLLLYFFGIKIPLIDAFSGISGIFFIQTGIPLPPIWDLLARGEVAIQFWGIFGANKLSILASTFGLWVINLILPALVGIWFVVRINVLKSIGYEQ